MSARDKEEMLELGERVFALPGLLPAELARLEYLLAIDRREYEASEDRNCLLGGDYPDL